MRLTARARELLKAAALRRGLLVRRVPRGRHGDAFADQAWLLRRHSVRRIFDVGAYEGQTVREYRRAFPHAEIHCFEPLSEAFARLREATGGLTAVFANHVAVSDSGRPVTLHVNRSAATSSRLVPAHDAPDVVGQGLLDSVGTEVVDAVTIDEYCRDWAIDQIDVLKVDVQGGELAVLRGAAEMLARGRISLVYVELLTDRLYEAQPGAGEVLTALEHHGYRIFGLYNSAFGKDASLYQVDAILTSSQVSVGCRP